MFSPWYARNRRRWRGHRRLADQRARRRRSGGAGHPVPALGLRALRRARARRGAGGLLPPRAAQLSLTDGIFIDDAAPGRF